MVQHNTLSYSDSEDTSIPDELISESPAGYEKSKDFTTLIAWQNVRELKLFLYNQIIPKLPACEKYNLSTQMTRAAISITANISEGYGRFHYKESVQFYRISRGSLYELKDHLISCHDLKYIQAPQAQEGFRLIEKSKMSLNGYINYVRSKIGKS